MKYRPCFSDRAVAYVVGLSKRRQRVLLDRVRELASDPVLPPDLESIDSEGRNISHIVVDDFAIAY
jgi:hypothetical protein